MKAQEIPFIVYAHNTHRGRKTNEFDVSLITYHLDTPWFLKGKQLIQDTGVQTVHLSVAITAL